MQIRIEDCRASFLVVLKPKQYQNTPGTEAFSGTVMIPKEGETNILMADSLEPTTLPAVIQAVFREAWPKKSKEEFDAIRANPQKFCYRDGNKPNSRGKTVEEYDGHFVLATRRVATQKMPKVFTSHSQLVTPDMVAERMPMPGGDVPESGDFCHWLVDIWADKGPNGPAIRCGLNSVLYSREGEKFAASGVSEDGARSAFGDLMKKPPVAAAGSPAEAEFGGNSGSPPPSGDGGVDAEGDIWG